MYATPNFVTPTLVQAFGGQPFMAPPAFFTASGVITSYSQLVLGGPGSGARGGAVASGGVLISSLPF